jgi:hypothetical protein
MTKIEFLAASLPYGLKCTIVKPYDYKVIGLNFGHSPFITIHGEFTGPLYCEKFDKCIPTIRKLDTLTQECVQADYNDGKPFIPTYEVDKVKENGDWIKIMQKEKIDWDMLPSYVTALLLKWHFWPNKPEGEEVVYITSEFNPYK